MPDTPPPVEATICIAARVERRSVPRRPLDESDSERAIADEDARSPESSVEAQAADAEEARSGGDFTVEDLEREIENFEPSLEEQVMDVEDTVVELLDDERDVTDEDLTGAIAEELEWRMAEASEDEVLGTATEGDRDVAHRAS